MAHTQVADENSFLAAISGRENMDVLKNAHLFIIISLISKLPFATQIYAWIGSKTAV